MRRTKQEVTDIFERLSLEFKKVTPEILFDALRTERSKPKTFAHVLQIWLDRKHSEVGISITKSSVQTYTIKANHIFEWLRLSGKHQHTLDQLSSDDLSAFRSWLIRAKGHNNTHVNKCFDVVRSVYRYAFDNSLATRNPTKSIRDMKEPEPEIVYLDEEEISKIEGYQFEGKLAQERDILLLSCELSFHASDMLRIREAKIDTDKDGLTWLKLNRTKTGQKMDVFLSERAKRLIEKYNGHENFPIEKILWKRNQRLKMIAETCNINKHLSTKVGRKTFATSRLNTNEVTFSTDSTASMMGLTSPKYLKNYGTPNRDRIKSEILRQTKQKSTL